MRIIKTAVLWLVGLVAAVAAVVLGLQIIYKLSPVALSPETVALDERAAKVPVVTENGYRAYGLLAPKDVDPVRYGRCLVDAQNSQREERQALYKASPSMTDKAAYEAYWKPFTDRAEVAARGCAQGGAYVSLPKALADMRIKPGMTAAQWQALATFTPDPLIVARAEAVWAGDARRLGAAPDAPMIQFANLIQLERWRIARAVLAWDSGDRPQAVTAWKRSINDWVKSADDTLIDAMISAAALSQVMIGMQDAVSRSERIDNSTAEAALTALVPVESMPQAVADSIVTEWQSMSALIKSMPTLPSQLYLTGQGDPGVLVRALDHAAKLTYDVNDTLNRMGAANVQTQRSVLAAARGKPVAQSEWEGLTTGCASLGKWEYLCLPLLRNPTGRILVGVNAPAHAGITAPDYADYGVRIADVRNLAAATRLTIEARRLALSGTALASFVASAPSGMRDVFTGKPFSYDPVAKHLRIELHSRSSVLGDKEKGYELAL